MKSKHHHIPPNGKQHRIRVSASKMDDDTWQPSYKVDDEASIPVEDKFPTKNDAKTKALDLAKQLIDVPYLLSRP